MKSLFDALQVQVLAALPIINASGMVGGILAGIGGEGDYDEDNIRLMENLAHTAGRALERILLAAAIHERNVRLETILRTVSSYSSSMMKTMICNPQVAELTSVPASKVMGQPVDVSETARRGTVRDVRAAPDGQGCRRPPRLPARRIPHRRAAVCRPGAQPIPRVRQIRWARQPTE